jgi:hypothetical protein
MSRISLTPAQREIMRLVKHFNGRFGPLAMESAMYALSQYPETEWRPINNQLEVLASRGLLRIEESTGALRIFLTEEGKMVIGDQ